MTLCLQQEGGLYSDMAENKQIIHTALAEFNSHGFFQVCAETIKTSRHSSSASDGNYVDILGI